MKIMYLVDRNIFSQYVDEDYALIEEEIIFLHYSNDHVIVPYIITYTI